MFPLKDNIPAQHFPAVNLWLISINIICFLYELTLGPQLEQFIMLYGFVPARFMAQQSENWLDISRILPVFTSMFLHGNFFHLLSNMWMLWIFGDNVEDVMGRGRYLLFYLLCGVASVVAQTISGPASPLPMVGASGAISGVLGAYFLTYPRARVLTLIPIFIFFYLVEVPAAVFLGIWFLMQFFQAFFQLFAFGSLAGGGVAWWAHIGGFAAGVLLIRIFRRRQKRLRR